MGPEESDKNCPPAESRPTRMTQAKDNDHLVPNIVTVTNIFPSTFTPFYVWIPGTGSGQRIGSSALTATIPLPIAMDFRALEATDEKAVLVESTKARSRKRRRTSKNDSKAGLEEDCDPPTPPRITGRRLPSPRRNRNSNELIHEAKPTKQMDSLLVFPDALEQRHGKEIFQRGEFPENAEDSDDDDDETVSQVFFELANAAQVAYRIRNVPLSSSSSASMSDISNDRLLFHQDVAACSQHTGGIIWETSYLLLEYLLDRSAAATDHWPPHQLILGRTLELGAGVGFLGQCLAAENCCGTTTVLLTETSRVLANLTANLALNQSTLLALRNRNPNDKVHAVALDWTSFRQDAAASNGLIVSGSFDTLLGTDVLFAKALVEPLLATARFISHAHTIWYLCVQIRCATAHTWFLERAPHYGFAVHDITADAVASPRCGWGRAMDCLVFRITRQSVESPER